jgi:hypothetical protein
MGRGALVGAGDVVGGGALMGRGALMRRGPLKGARGGTNRGGLKFQEANPGRQARGQCSAAWLSPTRRNLGLLAPHTSPNCD